MHCRQNTNFPWTNAANISRRHAIGLGDGHTGSDCNFDSRFRRDQTRAGFLHDDGDIEKMIDVSMRNEDGIRA